MKNKLAKKLVDYVQLAVYLLVPTLMFAAPIPPGPGGTSPTPIDGGLMFLAAAGISYGVKRVMDARKDNA